MKETFAAHPNYASLEPQLNDVINQFSQLGDYVADGERNVIKKVTLGGETFNIKKFKTPNFFQGLVYRFLRKGKAERSFVYAQRLVDNEINTPFPVAYLERYSLGLKDSYYISKHLSYDLDFRVLNHNPTYPNRSEILKQFAKFTFKLHENDINFLDHSPGNTLILEEEWGQYSFHLIDLNRMRFQKMGFEKRMRNFRRLWLSKTMINIMAPVYAQLYRRSADTTHALMTKYSRAFQKKVNRKKLRRKRRE